NDDPDFEDHFHIAYQLSHEVSIAWLAMEVREYWMQQYKLGIHVTPHEEFNTAARYTTYPNDHKSI
ncbi:unnamed protein product, partial [Amoebophrya sp. A25]